MDSRRQQKVASVIKEAFSGVLLRVGKGIYGHALVTVTQVKTTPDLSEARFYLSIFNGDKEAILGAMIERKHELKRMLASELRHSLRHIPEITFFIDDTLDEVYKIEEIFTKLQQDKTSPDA
jgi:ribosome-binding factor A